MDSFIYEDVRKPEHKPFPWVVYIYIEKLKASKNQEADVKAAFEAVKKDNAYLFSDTKVPRVISSTPGADPKTDAPKTQANEALRSLFGHNA